MGLFKKIIETSKDIKETTAEAGGMPSVGDSFRDIGKMFDSRGEREVLKNGVAGKAVVLGFPTQVAGDRFAMQIPLEIHPPQGSSYKINYVFPTLRMRTAIAAGMEVPVKIDPENPERIAVQWDAQKAAVAAAGGANAAVTASIEKTYGGYANAAAEQAMKNLRDGTQGAVAPSTFAPDVQSRIAQLDDLKKAGLIDDKQYQEKKQKLIDQL